ncbi:Xylose isomerase domain protein TIM barrel [Methanohalobium evestigatum Z-7303]|uniref:Xylose isomerase domain protein TIM barrel n=1 Tax=Methanohalobium evestigatum (strain ATCC BAA-1072 / DSM 3721 / NBRC 107634 / OCM 161 / Z-7303) TaxID=644295 RepID=D7EBF6_METEZ|nr:sugar phosphate isomerase/epimerase family protein [Methanohalobium evestigatum]ADI74673.1 Xylose isomerase domain protein TIM barrel [Methanohalobium evestigatum Z-7303]
MNTKRLSFSSHSVVDNPFNWVYELEDYGYTGWEIVQEGSQKLDNDSLKNVRELYETTNLDITTHLPFSDLNLSSLNPGIHREVLNQMKYNLEIASEFADIAVIHPGYKSPHGAQVPEKAWNKTIESLEIICDYADDYNMQIAVENMPNIPHIFGKEPREMIDIIKSVNRDNLGITFDIGHANTLNMVDDFLNECKNWITHIHIHDNTGKKDEHLPVGSGDINWKKVFKGLSNYKGRYVTELRTLEDGIKSLEYIKSL